MAFSSSSTIEVEVPYGTLELSKVFCRPPSNCYVTRSWKFPKNDVNRNLLTIIPRNKEATHRIEIQYTNQSKMSPNTEKNNTGILDQARNFVHEAVKTQEQRQKEEEAQKSVMDKITEKIPANAEEARASVGKTIDQGIQNIKENFQERLNEDSEGNKIRNGPTSDKKDAPPGLLENVADVAQEKIKQTREYVYDVTKSEREKEAERRAEMSLMDKVQEKLAGASLESAGKQLDNKLGSGVEKVKDSLPEETDTFKNAGANMDKGVERTKELMANKVDDVTNGGD